MSKYGNHRVTEDGITFDSLAELRRYRELKMLQVAGHITVLEVHPRHVIMVNGVHVCDYVADFYYIEADGQERVEDVKGVRTAVYRLKKRLMQAVLGIEVIEVQA